MKKILMKNAKKYNLNVKEYIIYSFIKNIVEVIEITPFFLFFEYLFLKFLFI